MTLAEALRYQQELDAAQRPAYGNPNLAAQGRNANIAERSRAFPFMQAADAQFQKEKSSLSDPRATTDLINKGFLAGLGGAPVDLINMGLTPLGMGSAFPFGGSEHIKRAMEDYGVATPTERPIFEGITSLTPPRAVMGAARFAGQGAGAVGRAAAEIANAEMAGRAGLSGQGGAITYHGSPHRFPPTAKNPLGEFDPMKIGTGEGAQAYGVGAGYLAENPQTARIYSADRAYVGSAMQGKPSTINFDDPAWLAQKTIDEFGDTSKATSHLKMVQRTAAKQQSPETKVQVQAAIDLLESGNITTKGSFYKVDLADEQIPKMLDWDKPFDKQHPEVQQALVNIANGEEEGSKMLKLMQNENPSGKDIFRSLLTEPQLIDSPSGWISVDNKKEISKLLQTEGIPGIRYLDQGSRAGGAGTSNFVVFDPAHMNILERDGVTAESLRKVAGQQMTEPTNYLSAKSIVPPHGVRDTEKLLSLTKSMKDSGWQGRPILTYDVGRGEEALTGSHRIEAARQANIDVPIYRIENAGDYVDKNGQSILDVGFMDIDDQVKWLDKFGDKDAAKLLKQEPDF